MQHTEQDLMDYLNNTYEIKVGRVWKKYIEKLEDHYKTHLESLPTYRAKAAYLKTLERLLNYFIPHIESLPSIWDIKLLVENDLNDVDKQRFVIGMNVIFFSIRVELYDSGLIDELPEDLKTISKTLDTQKNKSYS